MSSDLNFENRSTSERAPAEDASKALMEDRWGETHVPSGKCHVAPSLLTHSDLIEKSTLPSSTPKENNDLLASTINCFKWHPQEMIGSAVLGFVGTCALMKSGRIWSAVSEFGTVGRNSIFERIAEPATNLSMSGGKSIYAGLADGSSILGSKSLFTRGESSTELTQILDQSKKFESLFPEEGKVLNPDHLRKELPDGTIYEHKPGLITTITKPNGVILGRHANGITSLELPNGTGFYMTEDGARAIYLCHPDGNLKATYYLKPGSKQWERLIDGVLKPTNEKLPFSTRDPFEHELKKVLSKIEN